MTPPPFRRSFLVLLAAALAAGCSKAPPAAETPPAAPVLWQGPLNVAPEEWVELVGATQPLPGAVGRVTAAIDGRIDALLVFKDADGKVVKELHEGDVVKAKDPVARLDDRIARFNRDKAKSAVDAAWQEVAQAQTALTLALDQLTSLQEFQKKNPNNPNLVPELQMKTAQGAVRDARSKLLAAQQRHDQAKKDVEALDAQLALYTLTAPIAGRLGRVQAAVGQTLAVGAEIAEVVNIEDQIDVLCFVSQRDAAGLQVGQPALLGGFDARPEEVRTTDADADGGSSVVFVSDKAEPETGCFVVKVRFPNKDPHHLRGNVVQRVRVQTRTGDQVASLLGEQGVVLQEDWLIEDRNPPSVVIVEDVKTQRNDEGKEEKTGTARRLSALIAVRDREKKLVGVRGLVDSEGKEFPGPLQDLKFVTQGAQGLQTGDPVRLQQKED